MPFRRSLQTSCLQATPFAGSHAVQILNTLLLFGVRAHFHSGRRHAAFSSVTFCRLQSSGMGFTDSPLDNTIRIAMTILAQIQNQPLVSCSFLTIKMNTRQSVAASATGETAHRGHSPQVDYLCSQVCFIVLSKPGSHFHHAICAQLLQPQHTRIQVTHTAEAKSRGHCPSCRRVRFTHHFERQPVFHHGTANLQCMGCTFRDRDVLILSS